MARRAPRRPVASTRPPRSTPGTHTISPSPSGLAVALLVPGTELPVLVDRHDRDRLIVDWDTPV